MDRDVFAVHSELEQAHWWFSARRRILRRIVDEVAGPGPGKTVLDIGCGVGATLGAFEPDYRAIGYDPSADAIEFGRRRHPGCDLRVGGVEAAIAAVPSADVVLLNDVIEHVPDDRALLAPVAGALRSGAILLITVPADMRLWSPHDVALGHYRRYDAQLLRVATQALPVETVFMTYFNSRLFPLVLAARTLARWSGIATGRQGTDLRATPRPINALLEACFAGEIQRLLGVARGQSSPYRRGVSLMGVFRRAAS
jgi:SAM-dependent methyltransferase